MELGVRIEALLFATDQPLSVGRIAEVLGGPDRAAVESAIEGLRLEYEASARAFQVVRVAGGYQLTTRPELVETVRRLYTGKRRVRLTKAALESLAIIAYKQPTTRPEIDSIRGVSSGGVLETLLERNLVRIAGRSEGVGRPLLYATTPEFLQYIGLNRIEDLPSLEELESMLAEREAAARLEEDQELEAQAEAARADTEEGEAAPAARLEERLRARDLPTLDELDAELQARSEQVSQLSARVAALRTRHDTELAVDLPADAGPEPPNAPEACD